MSEHWHCYHGGIQRMPARVPHNRPCPDCGHSLPCDHIWLQYAAGEDASATLSAPVGTARWSEPVVVCTVCGLIQPESWSQHGSERTA